MVAFKDPAQGHSGSYISMKKDPYKASLNDLIPLYHDTTYGIFAKVLTIEEQFRLALPFRLARLVQLARTVWHSLFHFDLRRLSCLKLLETNFFLVEVALFADLIVPPEKEKHQVIKRVRLCHVGCSQPPLCAEGNYLRGLALPTLC